MSLTDHALTTSNRRQPQTHVPLGKPDDLTCVSACAPGAIRTRDTRFRRAVLYPLSYGGLRRGRLAATARGYRAPRPGGITG